MKAVYTVGVRAYVAGDKDSHGNPVASWADPVDLAVFSIAPRFTNEDDPTRPLVVIGLNLLAPPGSTVGTRDHVVVDGVTYEVDGDVADWTKGPWSFAPGVSINLKRWKE